MDAPRLLLVEDDVPLARLVREYLEREGYRVDVLHTGRGVVERVAAEPPDAVILDWGLPGEDGLSICRRLRERYAGRVLMLTARGGEVDHVLGLEMGADDYLAKPVSPRLLLARLRALQRREERAPPTRVVIGALTVDRSTREATLDGATLDLSTAEFDLLWALAARAGEPLDRDRLYREVYGSAWQGAERALDILLSRLRRKLEAAGGHGWIKTIRGVGYLLAARA